MGLAVLATYLVCARPIQAAGSEVTTYTTNTLHILVIIAGVAASLFLVYAGYLYITSSGRPEALLHAKKTLRNVIVGLVMVLAATSVVTIFQNALSPYSTGSADSGIHFQAMESIKPSDGLTLVITDAVSGFAQNIIQSGTNRSSLAF